MNRIMKILCLTLFLFQSDALYSASPSGVLTGTMDIYKALNYSCYLEINIDGNIANISLAPGSSFCSYLTFSGAPYTVSYNGSNVIFHNVDMTTFETGDCFGDLVAEWNGVHLIFNESVLPAKTVGGPCFFMGLAS